MRAKHWARVSAMLAEFPELGLKQQDELKAEDFGLAGIQALLDALRNPHGQFLSIHVAGSNGKGSVCALCAAALQAQGYRVGVYTSPHLSSPLEGVRLDGTAISPDKAAELLRDMLPEAKQIAGLTRFELVTALTFLHFAAEEVDVAVVEAGLGGRLDATNVLAPLVAVITPIDLEHQSILGDSLEKIAQHKAGIIKPGMTVVSAPQDDGVLEVLEEKAWAEDVPLIVVGREILFERSGEDLSGQRLRVWGADAPDEDVELKLGMLGAYQAQNAATAFAALGALRRAGIELREEAIRAGFARARWPGRFQLLREQPPIVLDAAHTPGGARALRESLDALFPHKPVVGVFGVSADKDVEGLLSSLDGRLARVIATQSAHPRAMPAQELAQRVGRSGIEVESEADLAAALKRGRATLDQGELLLVFGSVFLVEQAGELL